MVDLSHLPDDSGREPSPRSIGFASERDTKRALQSISHTCYWGLFDQEFFRSDKAMVIGRTDGIGGDARAVYWAWKYDNIWSLMRDWLEITHVFSAEPTIRKPYQGS